jgi:hypothetical protein
MRPASLTSYPPRPNALAKRISINKQVLNSVKGKKERIGRMLEMNANDRTDVDYACAGDIVALVGCKDTTTGETLCAMDSPVILEKMDFPDPVISVAVEPKTKVLFYFCFVCMWCLLLLFIFTWCLLLLFHIPMVIATAVS